MTDYNAALTDATARGYRVPISEPVDYEAWLNYWATLEAIANGATFLTPDPPDGITFMERTEARTQGRTKYWTGRKCSNDHMAPRYTASGACGICVAASQRRQKRAGTMTFKALIHKEDEAMLRDTVAALNAARGL